ncbi:MAG: hypothetical protein IJP96_07570 [Synergistaceae bacterium]|nr:hypothetical protein [Synergistaceae bacterium]MBR0252703.1 hypothetical protein [Synergistaceae bacterium]
MSISFSELLIYLLPGFLGLWVFKRIVQEDLDKRSESTQIAIALLLGISAIILLFVVNFVIGLTSFTWLVRYISPNALSLRIEEGKEIRLILDGGVEFLCSYTVLCILAIMSGGLWALLSEIGLTPTRKLPDWINKLLKRDAQSPCESALRALVDRMSENNRGPFLVKIYMLGENRNDPLIGWWQSYSETEKEISLTRIELCEAEPELKKLLVMQPRDCWINHNSGVVVEFLDWDAVQDKGFNEYLRTIYRNAVSKNSRLILS